MEPVYAQAGKRSDFYYDNPLHTALDKNVHERVKTYLQSPGNTGLAIGILQAGEKIYYNYGTAKKDSNSYITNSTAFSLGALSTIFTDHLFWRAIKENRLSLDDDVRKFLPENCKSLCGNHRPVAIHHLVTHSSGLPNHPSDLMGNNPEPGNPYKHYGKEQMFVFLARCRPLSEPGSAVQFSSLNYIILQLVLEKVFNKDTEDLSVLFKNDFLPENTHIASSDIKPGRSSYDYDFDGKLTEPWQMRDFPFAGGLRSCVTDILRTIDTVMNSDRLDLIAKNVVVGERSKAGPGWFISDRENRSMFWQSAATNGSRSFCAFFPDKKIAIVILSNSSMNVEYLALGLLRFMLNN